MVALSMSGLSVRLAEAEREQCHGCRSYSTYYVRGSELHIIKENAHEVTRGMNPTVIEATFSGRCVGCATESEVRICTPLRR
jgi:hypothetical protein